MRLEETLAFPPEVRVMIFGGCRVKIFPGVVETRVGAENRLRKNQSDSRGDGHGCYYLDFLLLQKEVVVYRELKLGHAQSQPVIVARTFVKPKCYHITFGGRNYIYETPTVMRIQNGISGAIFQEGGFG